MIEIQAATLMWSAPCQNWMTMEAAEISAQRVIADAYQFYFNHGNQYWSVLVARKVQNAVLGTLWCAGVEGTGTQKQKDNSHSIQRQTQVHHQRNGHRIGEWNRVGEAKLPSHPDTASFQRRQYQ
jgi:hypothetical protein